MKRILSIVVICATFIMPALAHAAMTTMAVKGARQGDIRGDNTTRGQENTIVILALGSDMATIFDPSTGLPGRLQPGPITVTKNIDRSSPHLFEALATNEVLTDVYIRLYRVLADGALEPIFIIRLRDAHIVEIKTEGNAQVSGGIKESVSFIWRSMELTDVATGVTTVIDWGGPRA
jgi:type VI secretion system secreted protein Hcp